jgi:glutathione S-transferase
MPMTVYQTEWCPFSRKLRQRLTELGVEWCAPPVAADPPDRDAMREATGTDIIPVVILEDGTVLAGETDEILAALDERFDEPATAEGHKLAAAMH